MPASDDAGPPSDRDTSRSADDGESPGRPDDHDTVRPAGDRADERTDDGHYVYVLECADGTLYTGYTTDVERRVREHDDGDGAKYTRCRTPVELVHVESYASRSAAMSREHEIKQLTRREKERLVDRAPQGR